ncbi:hypothetical protein M406DRAFT_356722 [Cryphonectria parasitica EP155]|uniref:Uncharacterized protein n=1 Tax=Cryphonectria parasitica (strain ATCC 38755 / EP155) TaxID=660469 RepID=A0A9P4Y0U1_CRYP1|nr:uncharacterized protein M406DRAFT_356722 [Cryphonectria parasitica EP155]KAF3764902.1 hypothetical protein M406DRAFT_356722 [Cryphonectria parasitica EP155]
MPLQFCTTKKKKIARWSFAAISSREEYEMLPRRIKSSEAEVSVGRRLEFGSGKRGRSQEGGREEGCAAVPEISRPSPSSTFGCKSCEPRVVGRERKQ